jgi:hypothetical protein
MVKTKKTVLFSIFSVFLIAGSAMPSQADSIRDQVRAAQERLAELGYDPGVIDGIWGQNTQKAVEKYQKENHLEVTGELDSRTFEKLGLQMVHSADVPYPWIKRDLVANDSLEKRIETPGGYVRFNVPRHSFQQWLRRLPLKDENSAVYLYDGSRKGNQHAHFSVIDMDVGKRDLQQCADAVIRLRAEYLFSIGAFDRIHFKFTSGHMASFNQWAKGYRPVVKGNQVNWKRSAGRDFSYANFRKYLNTVFMYAGSYSLSKELVSVDVGDMRIGDVFIQGGFPGHAVAVVDMAVDESTGEKVFLLAQSYMPAQEMHILKNPMNRSLSPWYEVDFGQVLATPEWTFQRNQLKRFR